MVPLEEHRPLLRLLLLWPGHNPAGPDRLRHAHPPPALTLRAPRFRTALRVADEVSRFYISGFLPKMRGGARTYDALLGFQ